MHWLLTMWQELLSAQWYIRIWRLEFGKSTCLYNLSQNRKLLNHINFMSIALFRTSLKQSYFLHCWVLLKKKKFFFLIGTLLDWFWLPFTFSFIWSFCTFEIFLTQASLPLTFLRSLHKEINFFLKTSLLVQFDWWTPPFSRFWHLTLVEKVSAL